MSDFNWCHGPQCHEKHTQDRIRGVKGSKVLRTRKVKPNSWTEGKWYSYFCSQGCMLHYIQTHINKVIAIAPRLEALETPINVVKVPREDYHGNPYNEIRIQAIDNA